MALTITHMFMMPMAEELKKISQCCRFPEVCRPISQLTQRMIMIRAVGL